MVVVNPSMSRECQSCGGVLLSIPCQKCGELPEVEQSLSPFFLLNQPVGLIHDGKKVRTKYFKLQSILHPDKWNEGATKEKAAYWSQMVNKAYQTLQSPLKCAREMLVLMGVSENTTVKDPTLLMEQMAYMEEMALIANPMERDAYLQKIKGAFDAACGRFTDAWQANDRRELEKQFSMLSFLDKLPAKCKKQHGNI